MVAHKRRPGSCSAVPALPYRRASASMDPKSSRQRQTCEQLETPGGSPRLVTLEVQLASVPASGGTLLSIMMRHDPR